MSDILVTLAAGFGSFCFWNFPKLRGYVVMVLTVIIGITAIFQLEPSHRIIFWSAAIFLTPLLLGMIYYVFAASTNIYRLSFAFGHIASILIIWLMAAGSISYDIGYRAAADGEAYRKLQNDFDAYKAESSRAAEEHKQAVSVLQKRLNGEHLIRTELEAELAAREEKLAAQTKIRSDDMRRMNDVMHYLFFANTDDKDQLSKYYEHTLKMMQEEAAKGNVEANFLVGYILDPRHTGVKTEGIQQDADKAIQSYERAASKGHVDAQYLLGNLYYSVKNDKERAAKYYKLAAENGHEEAKKALELISSD